MQLIWTREEDVRQDFYRPAVQSRFRAALDKDGVAPALANAIYDATGFRVGRPPLNLIDLQCQFEEIGTQV